MINAKLNLIPFIFCPRLYALYVPKRLNIENSFGTGMEYQTDTIMSVLKKDLETNQNIRNKKHDSDCSIEFIYF
jgi:hypothetical protein